jgi:hypothetical protein
MNVPKALDAFTNDPGVFGASRHLHSLERAFASHSFGVHNLKTFVKSLLESWCDWWSRLVGSVMLLAIMACRTQLWVDITTQPLQLVVEKQEASIFVKSSLESWMIAPKLLFIR